MKRSICISDLYPVIHSRPHGLTAEASRSQGATPCGRCGRSDAVRDSVKQGSRQDCIIVAGDLNVRLARGHEYQTASGQKRKVTGQYTPAYKSSEGGEKVLNMCEELGLVVANTMFKPARQRVHRRHSGKRRHRRSGKTGKSLLNRYFNLNIFNINITTYATSIRLSR